MFARRQIVQLVPAVTQRTHRVPLSSFKRACTSASGRAGHVVTGTAGAAGAAGAAGMAAVWQHAGVRWITLGWSAFIAENLIMSHNRGWIISNFGDATYHGVYNTLSTAACGSIAYGFFRHGRRAGPRLWNTPRPAGIQLVAFGLQALALAGMAQLGPRFQVPVALVKEGGHSTSGSASASASTQAVVGPTPPAAPTAATKLTVRCPMDFRPRDMPADGVFGINRISRHPMLWCLSFLGLGAALTTPFAAEVAFYAMPTMFALIGGAHQDYRFRRGQGGSLPPEVRLCGWRVVRGAAAGFDCVPCPCRVCCYFFRCNLRWIPRPATFHSLRWQLGLGNGMAWRTS